MTVLPPVDVLIVGGGIHGVGVAQAAAAAGFTTALVESRELAAGTSSKSSKLIHGGLRYLESLEFGLVRESLRERELLLTLAPTLVKRQKFVIPIYRHTRRRSAVVRAGLSMYAVLAGMRRETWFRQIAKSDWELLDGLSTDGLQSVWEYTDAQTDDRQLTHAVMRSAQSLGATLYCPAECLAVKITDDGCQVTVGLLGEQPSECRIDAAVVVNAAGPWANELLSRVHPPQTHLEVDLVQGTHVELPGQIEHGCYYVEMPQDRRAVFVMPWHGRTLLGTTEQVYHGPPELVQPLENEIDYLLAGYRQYFPGKSTEVLAAWSGLRVLPAGKGTAFGRSRETQLPTNSSKQGRLVSIFGGKLTGYRATAEKVVKKLTPQLPRRRRIARTSELQLS